MTDARAYRLARPDDGHTGAFVFSSPHSGRNYPAGFLGRSRLKGTAIRSSEDAFVDDLFAAAPRHGATLIAATAPRAFIDLNRSADELDPALILDVGRIPHNPRIASGLGVIPRVVAGGQPIYDGKIARAEAEARLIDHWHPYHTALRGLMADALHHHGRAVLIDCHSMPHEALSNRSPRPDVVLGDRFGAACGRAIMAEVEAAFHDAGLRVSRNTPFAGAYITQAYGRPARDQHAVQVEIDRALYMDEARIEKRPDFDAFAALIDRVIARIVTIGDALPLAAE
ncbi:N-formylglutamate amidohydrolase [Falsirhodobacter halotolerans]|uniref:N-formylglutamate amidohydrolase n=1 Tax=Falsirhodobacter halotolerans TaxID=1146892 RepID=UPI001FD001B4|nr:N-formylglutamate amidohydrolase [Falsirhodobacter halotolerans]MCJ8138252.1 N-formylglutamate amidohydrolase [Falsirhodobacter halotolerans]